MHIMTRAAVGNFFVDDQLMLHGLTEGQEIFQRPSLSVMFQVRAVIVWG